MLGTRNLFLRNRVHTPQLRNLHLTTRLQQEQTSTPKPPPSRTPISNSDPPPNDVELGPLTRPLGVRERPTTVQKTNKQRIQELMDSDVRTAQRRHLIKEATKGYFHDLNMTRRHGGKTWIAPKVLIREDKSLYFPNITGKLLSDKTQSNTTEMMFGKVTVLSMLGTQISEVHSKVLTDPTYARFKSHPKFQLMQINLQENMLKAFLVNLYLGKLREKIPEELQKTYLMSTQSVEYIREAIGMTNSTVGYTYLIDENLRIRWAACADPLPEELQALESCTGVLLKRLDKRVGSSNETEAQENSPCVEPTVQA